MAQQSKIDSLQLLLARDQQPDTTRLKRLAMLGDALVYVDPKKGLEVTAEGIEQARRLHDSSSYLMNLYISRGVNFWASGNTTEAKALLTTALAIANLHNDEFGKLKIRNNYSNILLEEGNLTEAENNYSLNLGIARKLKNKKLEAQYLINLGLVSIYKADYIKALDWLFQSAKMVEENNFRSDMVSLYSNIGLAYTQMRQHDKALQYFEKTYAVAETTNNNMGKLVSQFQLATIWRKKKQFDKALACLNKAKEIGGENALRGMPQVFMEYGIVYLNSLNFKGAIDNFNTGIGMLRAAGNTPDLCLSLTNLAHAYMLAPAELMVQQGISPASRYKKAEEQLLESIRIAEQIGNQERKQEALQRLSEAYAGQGNFEKAFRTQKVTEELADSLFSDEKKMEAGYLQSRYENEMKNAVLEATHQAELRQQRTKRFFTLIVAGIVLLVTGLLFWSYKRRRDAAMKLQEAELKTQVADVEMKVMRLQMNPHFIFNSLNSISDYIRKNNMDDADAYLTRFAKVMRMTLEHSEKKEISLAKELEALELYMQLEVRRLNNKFSYRVEVAPEIDPENTLVPPLIFQPFVENSIWHGIARKEGRGEINVVIRKEKEMLLCRIDDDGVGRKHTGPEKLPDEKARQSMGMKITKARIQLLNRLKSSHAAVELIDKEQGLTAELRLPLETAF